MKIELKDKNGKQIRIGSQVKVYLHGLETVGKVARIRPMSREIVFVPGCHYFSFNCVEVI